MECATDDDRLSELLARLRQALEDERRALLGGVPERIAAAVERKLALADSLEAEKPTGAAVAAQVRCLADLDRYNRENAVIVSALLRHMTQALDELRRHDAHRSYQPDGTERNHPPSHTLGAA